MLKSGIYIYLKTIFIKIFVVSIQLTILLFKKNGVEANLFKFVSSLPIYRTQLFLIVLYISVK